MRFAEVGAACLRLREPAAWLELALFITKENERPKVLGRAETVLLLAKARELAAAKERHDLVLEISAGIDVLKAAAPIEVPLVVFIERDEGEVEMGVLRLTLPKIAPKPRR